MISKWEWLTLILKSIKLFVSWKLKLVIIWELKHVEDVEGEECWKDDLDDKVSKIDDGSTDLW